jgi:alpha-glucosidase (family GH31 glycosyl hydrolase)
LPAGTWFDFWSNQPHTGGQLVTWTNSDPSKFPVFVKNGALIPTLLDEVRTLCDANYVNDASVPTNDGSWLVHVYPAENSSFAVYDGSLLACRGTGQAGTVTITSAPARRMQLRILADRPQTVENNSITVAPQATGPLTSPGWQYDASMGTIEVAFDHAGGTTAVSYQ